jgi:hypothetical protein
MPAGRGVGPPGPGQERAGCAGGPCVGVTLFAIRDLTPMSLYSLATRHGDTPTTGSGPTCRAASLALTMTRTTRRRVIPLVPLVLGTGLVASSFLLHEWRATWGLTGVVLLIVALMLEIVLDRYGKESPVRKEEWLVLGTIDIHGVVFVSDKHTFSDYFSLDHLPTGRYTVSVERTKRGADFYVSAFRMACPSCSLSAQTNRRMRLNVNTGFMHILSLVPDKEARNMAKEAEERILNDDQRDIDAQLVLVRGTTAGVVVATGMGDGQYEIALTASPDNSYELSCRFLTSAVAARENVPDSEAEKKSEDGATDDRKRGERGLR